MPFSMEPSSTPQPSLRSPATHKKKHSTSSRSNRPAPLSSKKANGSRSHRRQSSDEDVKHSKTVVVTDYDDNVLGEFCATCEKQILTPGTGRLYCSSKCAGQDSKRNSAAYPLHKTDIYLADTPPASPASATVPDSPSFSLSSSSRRKPSSYRYINYQSDTDRESDSEIDKYLQETTNTPSGSRPRFSRTITVSALQDLGKKPNQNAPSASGISSVPLTPTSSRNSLESISETRTSSSHPPVPYRSCRTRSRGSRWSNRSIDLVTPILNSPNDQSQTDVIDEGEAEGSDYGFPLMIPGEEAPRPLEINGAENRLSYDKSSPTTPATPANGLTRSQGYTTLSKLLHPEPGPFMPGRPSTPHDGSRPTTPRTKSTSTLIVK